jgi:predicted transcriptional regulator
MSKHHIDITSSLGVRWIMARVAFTLRIDAEERAALENLSKVERRPVNQLLNEAVRNFLLRRRPKERSLEANLERLRSYRERDPQFRRARKAFVEAEASVDDPLEGEPIEEQLVNGRVEPIGPAQSKIRDILGA